MKKILIITCFLIVIIGIWILLRSPYLGVYAFERFMNIEMEYIHTEVVLEGFISVYRCIGGILLGGGFLGITIYLFKTVFK